MLSVELYDDPIMAYDLWRATDPPKNELLGSAVTLFCLPGIVLSISGIEKIHQDEVSGEEELPVTEQLEVKEFVPSRL